MVVTRRKAEIVNIDDAVENNSCVLTDILVQYIQVI